MIYGSVICLKRLFKCSCELIVFYHNLEKQCSKITYMYKLNYNINLIKLKSVLIILL